ncbi:transglycosylase domain-containing protein [Cytobacillus purgationiresistens]|uniref:1A family penicillin-binding protein n=1 Tax=Cytobacillus purgationiresistens TaxID=863449 RepID=A0ABU0ALZ6_9BACI|nr:transglycosylase domain-containing protein [Cytobacillus purgationiresistens]MDQ0271761.1 1A family penicillin-binding protein [Cytobacillus purgationiresistens]
MEIMTDHRFRKTGKYLRAFIIISLIGLALTILLIIGIFIYAKILGPPPLAVPQSTLYLSNDGTVIGESNNGEKRYWADITDISPHLTDATIAIEDKGFYEHHGFDYKRIGGAVLADLKAMAKVQGASTISQQYARNLFLEHEKTWKRKLLEAFYTIRLEMSYSKEQILEGYLNTIYYGNGAYGAQAASQYYFGKDASELSLGEAAMLAGIPKGPSSYSPLASPEKAEARQKRILAVMQENGFVTKKDANEALSEQLKLVGKHQHTITKTAPYFQDAVRAALKSQLNLDDRTIEMGGLRVFTTLDMNKQAVAEKTIGEMMAEDSEIQVGFVAMNPKNGYIEAMVGGKDYTESPFNRALQAIRQPGSTIKPLLYYAALEQGFTPSTTIRSEPTTFRFDDGRAEYSPRNYNSKYANGEITMAQALALSDNIYAVKTHLFLGEDALVNTVKDFGITTKMDKVPSLALGTSGLRVTELANAYSMLANGGKETSPVFITKVEDYKGDVIFDAQEKHAQVLKPELAFVVTHMMTGVFDTKLNGYASVTGATVIDQLTRPYAAKSGSTETDSWMAGFSPQLVAAVWTGYDHGKKIENVEEKSYAKNIWSHFMEEAQQGMAVKSFQPPKETVGVYVEPNSGKLATEDCPVKRLTYFAAGTEPTEYCTEHLPDHGGTKEPAKLPKEKTPWYKKIFPWTS